MLNKSLKRYFAAKYDLAIIGGGPGVHFFFNIFLLLIQN
jgi:hypothetical protein